MNQYLICHVLDFVEYKITCLTDRYNKSKKLYDEECNRRKNRHWFVKFFCGSTPPDVFYYDFYWIDQYISDYNLLKKEATYLSKIDSSHMKIDNQEIRNSFINWCNNHNIPY